MSSWRRRLRRKQKPFIYLALLLIVNFLFPQHSVALSMNAVQEDAGITPQVLQVEEPRVQSQSGAIALPEIPALPTKRIMYVTATAYSSSRDETDSDPFTTASGAKVHDGVIASNSLAFGTRVRFPEVFGEKVFTVLDRLHPRKSRYLVDIWMPTKESAKQWGAPVLRMEIL